jgi:hypothetical protein
VASTALVFAVTPDLLALASSSLPSVKYSEAVLLIDNEWDQRVKGPHFQRLRDPQHLLLVYLPSPSFRIKKPTVYFHVYLTLRPSPRLAWYSMCRRTTRAPPKIESILAPCWVISQKPGARLQTMSPPLTTERLVPPRVVYEDTDWIDLPHTGPWGIQGESVLAEENVYRTVVTSSARNNRLGRNLVQRLNPQRDC